jgi:hypothetical protein
LPVGARDCRASGVGALLIATQPVSISPTMAVIGQSVVRIAFSFQATMLF